VRRERRGREADTFREGAKRLVREADQWKGSGETGRFPPAQHSSVCPRSGPVEGVWGNREVSPSTALIRLSAERTSGRGLGKPGGFPQHSTHPFVRGADQWRGLGEPGGSPSLRDVPPASASDRNPRERIPVALSYYGRRVAAQRAASASWSERNGTNIDNLTTPSSGRRSRSQTRRLSAAFWSRIVHAA